jgi:hypothetical protein
MKDGVDSGRPRFWRSLDILEFTIAGIGRTASTIIGAAWSLSGGKGLVDNRVRTKVPSNNGPRFLGRFLSFRSLIPMTASAWTANISNSLWADLIP